MTSEERKQLHTLIDHAINNGLIIDISLISHISTAFTASTLDILGKYKVEEGAVSERFPLYATGRIGKVGVIVSQHASATDLEADKNIERPYDHANNPFRQTRPTGPAAVQRAFDHYNTITPSDG